MKAKATLTSTFGCKVRQCLSDAAYEFFASVLVLLFRTFFRVRVLGLENCPKDGGPLLVASNHLSEWDPPFLGCFFPWQVHWLAKVELFELLGGNMAGFFRMLHCLPVDRDKVEPSLVKEVVRLLKDQRPVVVFAEGGIKWDETSILGDRPELKEGAAVMALLSKAPVLPVLLNGTMAVYHWQNWFFFRRCPLEIVIGPVFELRERDRAKATRQILDRMLELKPQLEQQRIC